MNRQHSYSLTLKWTGNKGEGTKNYNSYDRSHIVSIDNKADIASSADPAFRGDKTKHNPEELFVAAISSCHMLSYLYLCSVEGVVVIEYTDNAKGIMQETEDGSGQFKQVMLNPVVTVTDKGMVDKANELHHKANKICYIANSVNFSIDHKPVARTENG